MDKEQDETIRKEWIDYRNSVSENKSKSQDDFEKYINLMASGGLVLSLTVVEKIITIDKASYPILLITGMFLLVLTILSNLYSHYKSMIDSDKTILEIDEEKYDKIFENIDSRNKSINRLNCISIWSFIVGIICILSFVTLNFINMSDKPKPSQTENPRPLTEEKGRVTPQPPQNRPASKPSK
jgi:hypothetical protein